MGSRMHQEVCLRLGERWDAREVDTDHASGGHSQLLRLDRAMVSKLCAKAPWGTAANPQDTACSRESQQYRHLQEKHLLAPGSSISAGMGHIPLEVIISL